jgi:hypothetical protein
MSAHIMIDHVSLGTHDFDKANPCRMIWPQHPLPLVLIVATS